MGCYNGFYGSDCSNVTCPGDYCKYDVDTHQQICSHCCSAGNALRFDGELYDRNTRKTPCDKDHSGENHGICDGYGSCVCRPVLNPYNNTRDIQGIAWHEDGIDVDGWIIENEDHLLMGKAIRSYSGNFGGIDCSYIVAFAGSSKMEMSFVISTVFVVVAFALL